MAYEGRSDGTQIKDVNPAKIFQQINNLMFSLRIIPTDESLMGGRWSYTKREMNSFQEKKSDHHHQVWLSDRVSAEGYSFVGAEWGYQDPFQGQS